MLSWVVRVPSPSLSFQKCWTLLYGFMLANCQAPGALILHTKLINSLDICYKDCWLAQTDPLVVAES